MSAIPTASTFGQVVDVMTVPVHGDPSQAIVRVALPGTIPEQHCDVLIVGGGTAGVAAALACGRNGATAVVLEETDWIGGQLTAQGVSALDEHEYMEYFGGTASYYRLRDGIRDRYRMRYPRVAEMKRLNPGRSWVTDLAFEPQVAIDVLEEMILRSPAASRPETQLRMKAVSAEMVGDRVLAVVAVHLDSGTYTRYVPRIVIDATEFGDLVRLCGIDHIVGAEARATTGERHAQPEVACPQCVQSVTFPAALRLTRGGTPRSTLPETPKYGHFRDTQPYSLRIHVTGGEIYSEDSGWLDYDLFERMPKTKGSLWTYRRLVDHELLGPPAQTDVSIINWPGNDYRDRSLLTDNEEELATAVQEAKWASLGFVHWLQTEAARVVASDRDRPGIELAPEVYQTSDGLSKHPYVRESRRIVPMRRIVEEDVSAETQAGPAAAAAMRDSVGIGWYPIDIHAAYQAEVGVSLRTLPFQIPLSALVPAEAVNFIAAAKNIGTTHVTNGCYRLHPVEWNIGEAAGTAAAIAARRGVAVQSLVNDEALTREVQGALVDFGVPLAWIRDVSAEHPAFRKIQLAAAEGKVDPNEIDLCIHRLPLLRLKEFGF